MMVLAAGTLWGCGDDDGSELDATSEDSGADVADVGGDSADLDASDAGDGGSVAPTIVSVTPAGVTLLDDHRARKTAWLSTRLADLPNDDIDRLRAALEVLECLTEPPEPTPPEQSL